LPVQVYKAPSGLKEFRREVVEARRETILDYVEKVKPIVNDVAAKGYEAVRKYSEELDGVSLDNPVISKQDARAAFEDLPGNIQQAFRIIADSLWRFHSSSKPPETWVPGARLVWAPLKKVGVYAPGGKHPYPSTVLHTVIPARAAGVLEVAVATPPCGKCGKWPVNQLMLAAAYVAGADKVYAIGGAQAIAAMAYGAKPVEEVDIIVGPGNFYVQAAKLLVSGIVGIDMIAGPTELAVVADETADPTRIAWDMLAEAEHGPLSVAVLFTDNENLGEEVANIIEKEMKGDNELGVISIVISEDINQAISLADEMAAEHLVAYLSRENRERILANPPRAGIISIGIPPALLDYAYGPSHVLPTNGAARWRGGLSVIDFTRLVTIAEGEPASELVQASILLARLEGFENHAKSLENLQIGEG